MPRLATRHSPSRGSEGERVFTDDEGRLWSAALNERDAPEGALVFRRVGAGRHSLRALTVSPLALADASDDLLRRWLSAAPHVGTLP